MGMDCRHERCVEELLTAHQRQESAAAVNNERRMEVAFHEARSAWAESEEIRSELRAFMDEQRVFCGFLDTEQRSYQDMMRQEVTALSRLVDSILRTPTARDVRDSVPPEF